MTDFWTGSPEDQQRHYDVYRVVNAGGAPADFVGDNVIGYVSSLGSLARYNAGQGGELVQATDIIAFSLDENGGPLNIAAGYYLRERESGNDYTVIECHNRPNGWLSVTVKTSGKPRWTGPQVFP